LSAQEAGGSDPVPVVEGEHGLSLAAGSDRLDQLSTGLVRG
jgi:hypothetical protein